MKIRTLMLGGIATVAVAMTLAAPSFAQDASNPPQVSSPAERAQTQQLNGQAEGGTIQTPDPNSPQQQQYQAQQSQYQMQQEQHQQDQQNYQDQRARYEHENQRYENNIHHYDEAQFRFSDYPESRPYRFDGHHAMRLYLIAEPSQQLANAPVEGPSGEWVGRVRNVETGVDGRPSRVEVALNRRVSVWVRADELRFDARDHVVFSHLTRADLWNMPGATYESASR